ncbi:MAG: DUF554 domain-containing protein [Termitinemataceae bacterium]
MIATFINAVAVILGSALGILLGGKIADRFKQVVFDGAGITTLIIGVSMALASQRIIYLALSLILGGLLGTWADLDGAILRFGKFLEQLTLKKKSITSRSSSEDARAANDTIETVPAPAEAHRADWDFGHAFLNASVLFCVGAMALLGSFKAGTEADYTLLLTKSVLDGFMAVLMTAAMGPGVAFSALPILVYQGALTLAAQTIKPFVSPLMLSELTGVGGAMVLMIGCNLLSIKSMKTANFLLALVLIVVLTVLDPYLLTLAAQWGF